MVKGKLLAGRRPPTLLETSDDADRLNDEVLAEIVENQLNAATPPEARATLERLVAAGATREEAVHLIACVLSAELFEMLKDKRVFDLARYVTFLHALPELPYDVDEI